MTGFLYSLLRNAKPTRRALVQQLIKQFDDPNPNMRLLLYLADNLAYYPYLVQDEPLYIICQIDVLVTVTGTNLMVNFRDALKPNPNAPPPPQTAAVVIKAEIDSDDVVMADGDGVTTAAPVPPTSSTNALHAALDDEDDDDKEALYERLPDDTAELQNCIRSAQGCILLLLLKQHLKEYYGITDR